MKTHKGIVLVYVAVVLIVLIGIIGLSLDWGKLSLNAHQLHIGADAAALAGAQDVKFNQKRARDKAVALAAANNAENQPISLDRNESNAEGGELVLGRWVRQERKFYPTLDAPNAVKVVGVRAGQRADAPRTKLNFGPAFGASDAAMSRYAIAMSIGSTGAGIICLASDPNEYWPYGWQDNKGAGLVRDGGADIDLRGFDPVTGEPMTGDMQVNSESVNWPKEATIINGTSGEIYAGELNIVGSSNPGPDSGQWSSYYGDPSLPFSVNTKMPPVPDPLAALNDYPPDPGTMTAYPSPDVSGGQTTTILPGWYPNGLNPEGGTINMEPGIYAVGGGTAPNQLTGLVFNGGTLQGEGVTVYVTGHAASGILYGKVDMGAQANATLTSPGDVSPTDGVGVDGLPGVVLWQDINNHNEARVIGTPKSDLKGTLYFPDSPLHLGGGSDQMGNQVLAGALHIHGTVTLHVAYDGRNIIKAYRSILVE